MTENKQQKLIRKASVCIDRKNYGKAARYLRKAYTENGKFNALIMYFLGMMHERVGNYVESINCLIDAVEFLKNPNNVISKNFEYKIFMLLASSCAVSGMTKHALQFFDEAYRRCEEDKRGGILFSYIYTMISANTTKENVLSVLKSLVNKFPPPPEKDEKIAFIQPRPAGDKIHIVYLSPDFRGHVMYNFYYSFLKYYDKSKFYVTCISLDKREDERTKEVREMVDDFKKCYGMPFPEIARLLKSMRIDVAVDLAGHTANSGLALFRYRIAPVQISGLGWMESTGLKEADYLITDKFFDEPGHSYIVEKPLYMRSCFCYARDEVELPASQKAPCTEKGYITFGIFNRINKITDEMLIAWREILNSVPESKLLLKSNGLKSPKTKFFLTERMKKLGIDVERVILEPASKDYMLRYLDVDIALDTYPYCGGGTTFDALYMGVPVVSLYGERRSSRFGRSILNGCGLPELAVPTPEEYVERAVALASDWELLDVLHKNLRTMIEKSPAMDGEGYAKEMESKYVELLKRSAEGGSVDETC